MHIIDQLDDPLSSKLNIDWSTAKKNPYHAKITNEQRVRMMIELAFEKSDMSKEDFRKEIEAILA